MASAGQPFCPPAQHISAWLPTHLLHLRLSPTAFIRILFLLKCGDRPLFLVSLLLIEATSDLTMEQQATAPAEVRNVVNFLRSSKAGIKVRVGVLNGKRIDYFKGEWLVSLSFIHSTHRTPHNAKGKSAVKALTSPAFAKLKNVPKVESEEDAEKLLASIIPYAFYLRVDRGQPSGSPSSPKLLQVNHMQLFQNAEYYAWFYEGSQWTTYVGGIAMVAVMLAGVMFPLWPPIMRLGVWYLSIGVLGLIGLFFAIAIVRLIFYIITVIVASPGIWIFPKLFADVGFVSFSVRFYPRLRFGWGVIFY